MGDKQKILEDLTRAKALFQQRTILAAMGVKNEQVTPNSPVKER